MSWPKAIGAVLRASVARPDTGPAFPEAFAQLPPEAHDDLVQAAAFHGIGGYLAKAASAHADHLPPTLVEQANLLRQLALMRHLHVLADLRHLGAVLEDAAVPWLIVKGPVLSEAFHGDPALRMYADLDVLIEPECFGDALEALEGSGCVVRDRNWTLIHREMKGEVHVALRAGTGGDLHWHLLNDRPVRDAFHLRTDDVFQRVQKVTVGELTVPTLDDVDTVVYLALHTMMSGGHRLIWLKDIERALERVARADAVLARAREWGAELVLHAAMQRTARAIGLPHTAAGLRPRRIGSRLWLLGGSAAARISPPEREDGSESVGRFVARSCRPSAASSVAEVVHKGRLRVFHGQQAKRSADGRIDPSDPMSDQFEAGGLQARRAFLDEVRRSGRRVRASAQPRS
jgi:hypothetical protein